MSKPLNLPPWELNQNIFVYTKVLCALKVLFCFDCNYMFLKETVISPTTENKCSLYYVPWVYAERIYV